MKRLLAWTMTGAGTIALALLVAACGGGGGGGAQASMINGIPVPPAPNQSVNDATVAGVDSDTDGVRDDVERFVAENFGTDPAGHAEAMEYARAEQAAIAAPTQPAIATYVTLIGCADDSDRAAWDSITSEDLDTPERRAAYADVLAGAQFKSRRELHEQGVCN